MRPFGYPVTVLNTKDHLGKFDGKDDEVFFIRYSLNSKAFRVFNSITRIVKENLHIRFSKHTPNVIGSRPDCLFDIDALTRTLNYEPIVAGTQSNVFSGTKASDNAGTQSNVFSGTKASDNAGQARKETKPDDGFKPSSNDGKKIDKDPSKGNKCNDHEKEDTVNNTNNVNTVSLTLNAAGTNEDYELLFDPNMPALKDVGTFDFSNKYEDDGEMADMSNVETTIQVKQKNDGIFISQEKYDEDGEEVDVHMYRSMIGSLMYLTSSRPYIMFAVCACARYQVNPKVSHLYDVKGFLDGKEIIITESTVRRELRLADEEGVDCLPNSTIFENLELMGFEKLSQKLTFYKSFFSPQLKFLIHTILQCLSPKTTAWNEFSITMASAIICLATNQKLNFLKLIFDSMIRNLDNASGKFLMFPRVVKIFLDQRLKDFSAHKRIYIAPSHTKKVFANMRRVGKGFSNRITNLFSSMLVQNLMGEGSAIPTDPHHTPTILQPSSSQPKKTQKPRKPNKKVTEVSQPSEPTKHVADEAIYKGLDDRLVRAATTASSLEVKQDSGNIDKTQYKATPNEAISLGTTSGGGPRCQESMRDTIAQTRVLDLEKTKTTQALEITSLKRRFKKLEKKQRSRTHKLKRLYKFGLTARVDSSEDEQSLGKDASKHERKIHDIDADEDITLVNDQDDAEMFDVNDLHGSSTRVESSEDAGLGDQEDASKQGRMIDYLDADEGVALVDETQGRNDQDMFDTSILNDEEVVAEKEVSTADPVPTVGEVVTTGGVEVTTAAITS
nr:ribonuclease H-like domain-containing protein [Tanacetum cinerariifolium]